ncbi:hypothetical protein RJT34_23673 [Clitoria ternatea]|uniref:Uncharacterized protein n=1 Tax=Clitoria ternatea TaxID=43366 RepID=A0AAN9FLP3_CLITE
MTSTHTHPISPKLVAPSALPRHHLCIQQQLACPQNFAFDSIQYFILYSFALPISSFGYEPCISKVLKIVGMEEGDENTCIALLFDLKGKTKKNKKKNKEETDTIAVREADSAPALPVKDGNEGISTTASGVRISFFNFSVENFFRDMDTIARLCGEEHYAAFSDQSEIQRMSSSVTFLREWRDFKYPSRSIKFTYGLESSECLEGKDVSATILPQFSSVSVPKKTEQPGEAKSQECRDSVMNVGGSVWALDWCPRIYEKPDCSTKCEFIAVAAHPPGSSYHKMGAPLTGRGVIQIWCLVISENDDQVSSLSEKKDKGPRGRPRKNQTDGGKNDGSTQIKRPRGRPRKNLTLITADDMNCDTQTTSALAVQFTENSTEFPTPDEDLENNGVLSKKDGGTNEKSTQMKKPRGRPRKNQTLIALDDRSCETHSQPDLAVAVTQNSTDFPAPDGDLENNEEILPNTYKRKRGPKTKKDTNKDLKKIPRRRPKTNSKELTSDPNCENQPLPLDVHVPEEREPLFLQYENEANHPPLCSSPELESLAATCPIPDVTLPRVVSCLAHNGKVAWDVKWRPSNVSDSLCKHRMGYLAVLLGNGSLEVWEIPLPHVLRAIYKHKEGTDPRFIKLEPVFKCSILKRGGLQSIPLTVEWSVTPPHDYLLAGCHDGTVALWKFSTNSSSKCRDTKSMLCFAGDTVPIRTVAWAPCEGDPESSNVIVTAGHERLKFWDLRNPFRPLRNLQPGSRIIYSLDWLSKPSCIVMSFEDGTMKTISLVKAANDLPVTGEIYSGKKQPGLHGSSYSSFAIWSVQVSRITGMVAYCGADGTALRFQLVTRAVEGDYQHHRIPQFFCGSVTEEDSSFIINTPVSNAPFPRKSHDKGRYAESFRDLLSKSNQSRSVNNMITEASNSDSQTLAVCDGDNLGLESESEEAVKQPKRPKVSSGSKKRLSESPGLVCIDNDVSTSVDNGKSDLRDKPEVFPPKTAALHRVRWNTNKGCERWLCYGGASGLVRCQEIVLSDMDRKLALKK